MATPKELNLQVGELVRIGVSQKGISTDTHMGDLDAFVKFTLDRLTLKKTEDKVAKCMEILTIQEPYLYLLQEVDGEGNLLATPITLFEDSDVIAGRVVDL